MTLDECIDYAENQSEWMSKYAMIDIYKEKSEYYRQLAEWLKKLKAYESDDEICKYCTHTHNADYCNMCKHNTIFVDYFDLEGNTKKTRSDKE